MQESWIEDFLSFYNYIGPRPSKLHSVDRIENSGNYCDGNIRWATKSEQARNKSMRGDNHTGYTGVQLEDIRKVGGPENLYYRATWYCTNTVLYQHSTKLVRRDIKH